MFTITNNCCGTPPPKPGVTRSPCGREILQDCGAPFQNSILDSIWGKPFWLREEMQDLGVVKPPKGPLEIETIMRNGSLDGTFNPEKADPAFEWNHSDPIQPYSVCDSLDCVNPSGWSGPQGFGFKPEWPLTEKIAASESNQGICDNKYYRLITHYPSVGRPYQTADTSSRSRGLMISNIIPDIFENAKQVESYNYTGRLGEIIINSYSHDKNQHTNTSYPGDYWISWWNAIHPGNVKGYNGSDLFSNTIINFLSKKIKCDSIVSPECYKTGCDGITFLDEENQRANVVKVSSGEYHSCVLLDNGLCDCFGLTGTAGYTLSRPEELKQIPVLDINCGLDFTIAVLQDGITGWGSNNSGSLSIPTEFKTNSSDIVKLAVGGGHCVAMLNAGHTLAFDGRSRNTDSDGVIEIWGNSGYRNRLSIRPRIATTNFYIVGNDVKFQATNSIGEQHLIRRGEIIPFWGDRENFFNVVKTYESSVDEFGLPNDPISKEIEFIDIWAGRRHIVGLIKYPVYLSGYDLGKHILNSNDIVHIQDPYTGLQFNPRDSELRFVTIRVFSWGNGMPGDPYNQTIGGELLVRQANPNYLFKLNSLECKVGENNIPMHLLVDEYFDFRRIKYTDTFYGISDTLFLITSSTANHTVFARKKFNNYCQSLYQDDGRIIYRKNGDAALCDIPRGTSTNPNFDQSNTCRNGDCCCGCTDGSNLGNECCEQPRISLSEGASSYYKPEQDYFSCCQPSTEPNKAFQCCNNQYGFMLDGWGDDRFQQLTQIGLKNSQEYFTTPYINKHFVYESNLFGNTDEYFVKCAVGYDRTVASLSVKPTQEEINSGAYTKEQYKSSVYGAGGVGTPEGQDSTGCIPNILNANSGQYQLVNHLSAGRYHNLIIQNPDKPPKIDFPYRGEIDKSSNLNWRFRSTDKADSPLILLRSMGNTADWYQPEFDLNSSSRLLFDLDIKITKYRKEIINGELQNVKKKELHFKVDKTNSSQQNGISVNLIGTRGDQRVKPFTGATCDCVWSDYATDSFKMAGHQGTLLNHIGYDANPDIRNTSESYQWVYFNQLRGSQIEGDAPGGHEQPWRNFESAATKAFNPEYFPTDVWSDGPLKPKINYYYAPANSFTHNIIEVPPGKFPSELSLYCRNKYAYGGNNNIIQNWCDPCFKGITYETAERTGWMGRMGCTGCEFNYNEQLCSGCTFNEYGVWDCPETAPPIRDVYGYRCSANVFGDILPDEIIVSTNQVQKIIPELKNKPLYQKEIVIDPETGEQEIIIWNIGEVTKIKRKTFTFIPYDGPEDRENLKRIIIRSAPVYFMNVKEDGDEYEFSDYQYRSIQGNCSAYNAALNKYNSFGELSTPIEESWPSLNRYLIPRWASLEEDGLLNSWLINKNDTEFLSSTSYTEIDYPLVVVPAHGGDIGPKYNMEGYFDTELWSITNRMDPVFMTEIHSSYSYLLQSAFIPPPRYAYNFMPLVYFSSFSKSRYIKDSIDFEYPFNKNICITGPYKQAVGHYPEFRSDQENVLDFTPPPPGVFFHTKDIAYQNLLQNEKYKIEPLAGDSETGCSSCSIPFTGAKISAWGFDLQNDDIVNAVQEITELTGDIILDKEIGNLKINSQGKNGVWLGIAKDRFTSGGRIIKRLRVMVPINLLPGETIMFGRGVQIDNVSETQLNDGYFYTVEAKGKFEQYPNELGKTIKPNQAKENYEYRWGRFSDECSCNSRISLEDPNYIDPRAIVNTTAKEILTKYQTDPESLTVEERQKLIVGDADTGGIALVQYANCENPITYLESGASPKLAISAGSKQGEIGLGDMSGAWPIWNKSMCGNGYNCYGGGRSFHIGSQGNEILDPLILYSGKGPDTATIWYPVQLTNAVTLCLPIYKLNGTGVRGFWSDWLSNRGHSNFFTTKTNTDDDKDRVAGDIPFEASHPQGWLGYAFVNPTDGYWTTQIGGDSIGDLFQPTYYRGGTECGSEGNIYNTTSGTQFSSMSLWNFIQYGKPTIRENWVEAREDGCLLGIPSSRPMDPKNPEDRTPFPRTQNKKKQILKACCFGENYLNEAPSSVTNSVLPDRYSFNVRKNKYRNLYNAMYRSHPITTGNSSKIIFRKWHGDPFNPNDYTNRLKSTLTPVWADYWWAWDYNSTQCWDGFDWFKNIKEWRHRRWELPLFLGVNKDNIATMFINDPSPECYPETCSGLELFDQSYSGAFGGFKLGWNHRKYDSPVSHVKLNLGSLRWVQSVRGGGSNSASDEIWPPRSCYCSTQSSAPPKTGTFYAMNTSIWFNCYLDAYFPDWGSVILGGGDGTGGATDVSFSVDYSRWNPYFQHLGPGFVFNTDNLRQYSANIVNRTWPS